MSIDIEKNASLTNPMLEAETAAPELSIVMPCLNEAETLAVCMKKARIAFSQHGIRGEIVVADNGSTDGSQEVAVAGGATVVSVAAKGYGNALRGGIAAAQGKYIIFGDADDSYNFLDMPRFLEKLRQGDDLVMGNRFRGRIHAGAMPWKHRYIGNPILTGLGRLFFRAPVGDFHCGLRGFSRHAYERMALRTTGMEFASEMIIKAKLKGMRISEVPTDLFPDGRSRPPHLRSWRDGWRHLRFMLLLSPLWLFMIPGMFLITLGLVTGSVLITGSVVLGPVGLESHALLIAGLAVILGNQLVTFAIYTKRLAVLLRLYPANNTTWRVFETASLELGILVGGGLSLLGVGFLGWNTWRWQSVGFGALDPQVTMRFVIPAVVFTATGLQVMFNSFFLSFLGVAAAHLDISKSP